MPHGCAPRTDPGTGYENGPAVLDDVPGALHDGKRTEALTETLRAGGDTEPLLFNAFEPVALEAFEGLSEAWSALREAAEPYAGRPNASEDPIYPALGPPSTPSCRANPRAKTWSRP